MLGMTNSRFPSLADYHDIETTNFQSDTKNVHNCMLYAAEH